MPSLQKRRAKIINALLRRSAARSLEERLWDEMPPIGREFGSGDFDRLMAEDFRNGSGVFDPALMDRFRSSRG